MKKIERYPVIINIPIIPKATVSYMETRETESPYYCIVLKSDLDQLEREREEAVEALIGDAIELDKCRPHTMGTIGIKLWSTLDKRIALIKRLTGQSWQELKEMK